MIRYRKSMRDALGEVRGLIEDTTTSYPPKEINKKKHAAYKDPKKGEREIITKEADDPTVDDIAKGLKLDKKLVKKIMGEVFDYDEKVLDENVSQQIKTLKTIMAPMRGAKISIDGANKLMKIMDKFDKKEDLVALFKADIPFVSQSAAARLIQKFRMSGAEINKLREEVELDEMHTYTVVHVKHDKEVVKANSSYEAAKKYAQMKGLKSTAGVDAHLMEEVELDEGKMSQIASYIDDIANAMSKDSMMKPFITKFKADARKTLNPSKSLEKILPDYVPGQKIAKLLNMSEETINEFTKKDFDKNEDENKHTENGVAIVNKFGTSAEKTQMAGIASRHKMNNSISIQDQQARDKMINKYYKRLPEEVELDEQGRGQYIAFLRKPMQRATKAVALGQQPDKLRARDLARGHFNTSASNIDVVKTNVDLFTYKSIVKRPANYFKGRDKFLGSVDPKDLSVLPSARESFLPEGTMKGGLITDKVDEILKIGPKFVALISRKPTVQQLERMCVQELFDDSLLDDFYYIDPSSKGIVKSGNPEAKKAYGKHASVLHRVDPRSILQYNLAGRTFQGRSDGLMLHSLGAAMLALHLTEMGIPAIKINPDLELLDNPNYKGTKKISPDVILQNFRVSKSDIMRVIQMHMRDMTSAEKSKLVSISPKSLQYQFKENLEHSGARNLVEKIAGLQKKAEKSGMPYGILKKVFDRGMAAWKGGHRPGASQHQWAFARVNSFITKSSGTWGGADKDLAAKVRSKK